MTVRIPATIGSPKATPPVVVAATGTTLASKRRLLIADDLRDSADSLAQLLRMMGHDVMTAYDGEEAVKAAAEFQPDLVLLDIGMPKVTGYEACRRIRLAPWGKNMLLVALTGWGQERDRRTAEEAGFDYHLLKPASPAELLKLLATLEKDRTPA
jgi:CheY-like chemotaxis protein